MSIREFIQQLELKKHTDITLTFGYYLERYSEVSQFPPPEEQEKLDCAKAIDAALIFQISRQRAGHLDQSGQACLNAKN